MKLIKIYTSRRCGWAKRNYAALIEKGVEFQTVSALTEKGEKTKDFLKLTPYGKTPVMTIGKAVICESLIINEYIEDKFPNPALLPTNPEERACVRFWMYHCDSVLFPALYRVVGTSNPKHQNEAIRKLDEGLQQFERLGMHDEFHGPMWSGSKLGLVDLCYRTFFEALVLPSPSGTVTPCNLSIELQRWSEAIAAHPSVKEADQIAASLDRAA